MIICPQKLNQYTNSSCDVIINSDFYTNFTLNISFGKKSEFIQIKSQNSLFKLFNLFDRVGHFQIKAILIGTPLYVQISVEGKIKKKIIKLRY